MYAEIHIGLPSFALPTVWRWFLDLPVRSRKLMKREGQTEPEFHRGFDEDLICLVFDGPLLGCVVLEKRDLGAYEVHLFSPRHTPSEKLAEAIATFFQKVKKDARIKKLLFPVRALQARLGQCIINEGCVITGWSYRERGEVFRLVVFEKELQKAVI